MANPQQADHFLIPLLDGSYGLGQVIEASKTPSGTCLCAFTALRSTATTPVTPLTLNDFLAIALVATDQFQTDNWPIIGFEQIPVIRSVYDVAYQIGQKFHGIPIHETAIVEAFVNACHGLYPWDGFPDPAFFTTILLRPGTRPDAARLSKDFPK